MPSKKSRIQLYADECFPVTSATHLKSLGYSIVHAFDKNNVEKSDRYHLLISKKLGRTLITLDRDFIYYQQANLKDSSGVIVISVGSTTPMQVNKVCGKLLKTITKEFIKNSLIKVTMDKIIRTKNEEITERKL